MGGGGGKRTVPAHCRLLLPNHRVAQKFHSCMSRTHVKPSVIFTPSTLLYVKHEYLLSVCYYIYRVGTELRAARGLTLYLYARTRRVDIIMCIIHVTNLSSYKRKKTPRAQSALCVTFCPFCLRVHHIRTDRTL